MGEEIRYFVDKRIGCVAVRDSEHTNPEDQGLHEDTCGVIKFWSGKLDKIVRCPTCGHLDTKWDVDEETIAEAEALCEELNKT